MGGVVTKFRDWNAIYATNVYIWGKMSSIELQICGKSYERVKNPPIHMKHVLREHCSRYDTANIYKVWDYIVFFFNS